MRRGTSARANVLAVVAFWMAAFVSPETSRAQSVDPYLTWDGVDVVLDGPIQEKATALNNDPVAIFQFVRNSVRYSHYWGLMRGPVGTLQSLEGNDYDQAVLLVSLLRAAGYRSRFVRGEIRLTCDQIAEWLGIATVVVDGDENCGGGANFLRTASTSGFPATCTWCAAFDSVSKLTSVIHIWVEAEVPLANYRGRRTPGDDSGRGWVPLDPSIKAAIWPSRVQELMEEPGWNFARTFNLSAFMSEVSAVLPLEAYGDQIQDYLNAHDVKSPYTGANLLLAELYRDGEVIPLAPGVLPMSLPYEINESRVERSASLKFVHETTPADNRTIVLNETGTSAYRHYFETHICRAPYIRGLNIPAGQSAATRQADVCRGLPATDANRLFKAREATTQWIGRSMILQFLPAGAFPSGGYEAMGCGTNLTPKLYRDGVEMIAPIVEGAKASVYCEKKFVLLEHRPPGAGSLWRYVGERDPGGTFSLLFDVGASVSSTTRAAEATLRSANALYPIADAGGANPALVNDGQGLRLTAHPAAQRGLVGGVLNLVSKRYGERLRESLMQNSSLHAQLYTPPVTLGLVSADFEQVRLFGQVVGAEASNWLIDAQAKVASPISAITGIARLVSPGSGMTAGYMIPLANNQNRMNIHALVLGVTNGSALEHAVWEEVVGTEAISTVKGLQLGQENFEDSNLMIVRWDAPSCGYSPGTQTGLQCYTTNEATVEATCRRSGETCNVSPCVTVPELAQEGCFAPSGAIPCPNAPACTLTFGGAINPSDALNHLETKEGGTTGPAFCLIASAFASVFPASDSQASSAFEPPVNGDDTPFPLAGSFGQFQDCSTTQTGAGEDRAALCRQTTGFPQVTNGGFSVPSRWAAVQVCNPGSQGIPWDSGIPCAFDSGPATDGAGIAKMELGPVSGPRAGRVWRWRLTGNWFGRNGLDPDADLLQPTATFTGPGVRPTLRVLGLPGKMTSFDDPSDLVSAWTVDFLRWRGTLPLATTDRHSIAPGAEIENQELFPNWIYLDEDEVEQVATLAESGYATLSLDATIVKKAGHGNDPDYAPFPPDPFGSGGSGFTVDMTAREGSCSEINGSLSCTGGTGAAIKNGGIVFDTLGCDDTSPMSGATQELRISDQPFFTYKGFEGYVYYRQSVAENAIELTMAIAPQLPEAKGGYSLFGGYIDPFRDRSIYSSTSVLSYQTYDPYTFAYSNSYLSSFSVGDPVSVAGGHFFDVSTDFSIRGRGGFDLRFVRSYNSRQEYAGDLGRGWIHSFEQHLRYDDGTELDLDFPQLLWVDEKGNETPWSVKPNGVYEPEASVHHRLEALPNGYRITTKEGMRYEFGALASGRAFLTAMIDRNGNAIRVERANGRVSRVIDTVAREVNFSHLAEAGGGRTVTVSDFAGRSWRYHVDDAGNMDRYTSAEEIARGSSKAWQYSYHAGDSNSAVDNKLKCWVKPEGGRTPTAEVPALCGSSAQGHSWMALEYYGNGSVRSHTDSLGQKTAFYYDYFGKRTRVEYPDGAIEEYQFDKFANIIRHRDRNGVVKRFEFNDEKREQIAAWDGLGLPHRAHYDDRGNMNSRTDRVGKVEEFAHDAFGQVTWHKDRRGNVTETKYDFRGNPLQIFKDLDGARREFARFEYDASGNLTAETELRLSDSELPPARTEYGYDVLGVSRTMVREPVGGQVEIQIDSRGNPTRVSRKRTIISESGEKTVSDVEVVSVYDSLDRAVLVSQPNASPADPRSHWVGVEYDADGSASRECSWVTPTRLPPASAHAPCTTPAGGLAAGVELRLDRVTAFDVNGRVVATTDALGNATSFIRDAMDRVVETRSPLGRARKVVYDTVGNVLEEISPSGRKTRYFYDGERRRTTTVDALGRKSEVVYDPEGRALEEYGPTHRLIRKVVYDENGNPLEITDGAGTKTTLTHDELNRLRVQRIAAGTPEEQLVYFEYDLLGRLMSRRDGEGHYIRVAYDANGRPVSQTDELGRRIAYAYDESGSVTHVQMPDGRIVKSVFDDRGLLTRRWGSGFDERHAYDPRGRVVSSWTAEMREIFEYDELDRGTSVTNNFTGTSRVSYDADGLVQNYVYPNGARYGFPESKVARYVYDPDGLLSEVIDPDAGRWQYQRDEIGREIQRVGPNGNLRRLSYYPTGFVASVENKPGSLSILETYPESEYDVLGNPREIIRSGATTRVSYDRLSRVKSVRYSDGSASGGCGSFGWECFEYDKAGNRREHYRVDGTRLVYNVDAADQLTSVTNFGTGAIIASYEYDGAGRRTKRTGSAGAMSYYYDALGRLISAGPSSSNLTTLSYGSDAAVFRRADASGSSYSFSGGVDYRAGGRWRTVGAGVDGRTIAEVSYPTVPGPPTAFEQMADGRGNVAVVGLTSGLPWWNGQYRAFGESFAEFGVNPSELGFSGSRIEGGTGLVRMGARHYDPAVGRFLQSDPVGIQTDQLYAYGANNPYVYSDPDGLSPFANSSADLSLNRISSSSYGGYSGYGGLSSSSFYSDYSSPRGGALQSFLGVGVGAYVGVNAAPYAAAASAACPACAVGLGILGVGALMYDATTGFESTIAAGKSLLDTFTGNATFGDAFQVGVGVGIGGMNGYGSVKIPGGRAYQDLSFDALRLRADVGAGRSIYRGGSYDRSQWIESQFWAVENPLSPGFASRVGAATLQGAPDFVLRGSVSPGSFITRTAPGIGKNLGGSLEIVTNPGGVRVDAFHMMRRMNR